MTDIIERVRGLCPHDVSGYCKCTAQEAADRIETLERELEVARYWGPKWEKCHAELASAQGREKVYIETLKKIALRPWHSQVRAFAEAALAQTDDYSVLKAAEYLRQLSPHVATREGAVLLADAKAEIVALRAGVNECYRMLISEPNTKLALDKAELMLRELMKPND